MAGIISMVGIISVVVQDPKNDPRHLRLKGDRLILWGIRPGIV